MPDARVSIRDVAVLAGVSLGTVSNVLNRPDRVAVATRERVEAAVDKLGFVRNESARQLRAGSSRMIGLIVLDASNPFFTDMARGAEQVVSHDGSSLVLCNSNEDDERESVHLQLFEEIRARGLLISPVSMEDPHLQRLRERGIPVVLVDRMAASSDLCSVAVDDVTGGRLAVEHLLSCGHRHIGVVGGPHSIRQVTERHEGARKAVAENAAGTTPARLEIIDTPTLTIDEGMAAGERVADLDPAERPTALFATNDLIALGLLQTLARRGLRVPEDVALIGYDDIDFAAAAAIPLSSIRQPRDELGRHAAALLLDEINAPDTHRHERVTFTPELIARESTLGRP
ncbi:MAG TPA: LacI family DNA-binding transcriptional regulator [Jiangellaceae bacterium]|nr:LacI family DNA-binding transcriptional regulator [Jiangellaceae bacterium]